MKDLFSQDSPRVEPDDLVWHAVPWLSRYYGESKARQLIGQLLKRATSATDKTRGREIVLLALDETMRAAPIDARTYLIDRCSARITPSTRRDSKPFKAPRAPKMSDERREELANSMKQLIDSLKVPR